MSSLQYWWSPSVWVAWYSFRHPSDDWRNISEILQNTHATWIPILDSWMSWSGWDFHLTFWLGLVALGWLRLLFLMRRNPHIPLEDFATWANMQFCAGCFSLILAHGGFNVTLSAFLGSLQDLLYELLYLVMILGLVLGGLGVVVPFAWDKFVIFAWYPPFANE